MVIIRSLLCQHCPMAGSSYSTGEAPSGCQDRSSWCSDVQHLTLNQLWGIPATHNSACVSARSVNPAWLWARTQHIDLQSQLHIGVRAFDLRLCDDVGDGLIWVSHTFVSSLTFNGVLDIFRQFLRTHPSEFVMVQLRRDFNRKLSNPDAIAALVADHCFYLPMFEPLGLDTPLHCVAGGLIIVSPHFPRCSPVLWPDDLFEGQGCFSTATLALSNGRPHHAGLLRRDRVALHKYSHCLP